MVCPESWNGETTFHYVMVFTTLCFLSLDENLFMNSYDAPLPAMRSAFMMVDYSSAFDIPGDQMFEIRAVKARYATRWIYVLGAYIDIEVEGNGFVVKHCISDSGDEEGDDTTVLAFITTSLTHPAAVKMQKLFHDQIESQLAGRRIEPAKAKKIAKAKKASLLD